MPLTSKVTIQAIADLTSALDLGTASSPLAATSAFEFTNGSGANQASAIFSDTRTLTASATETLDLNGVLLDAFGATISLTKVKALIVRAASTNVNDVIVGGSATNAFASFLGAVTETIKVKPGGAIALIAPDATGYAVTAATGDLLKITNSGAGTSVVYDIILIGA